MKNESITRTFTVAAVLCVVCAIIVSLSNVALKSMQQRNKELDMRVNILSAAGLVKPNEKVAPQRADELFANAQTVVVDLESGEIVDKTPEEVEADKTNVIALDPADDLAGLKQIKKYAVVYLFNDESGALETAVLPIVGTGLWSTMYGFLALNGDLTTVAHIVFYEHGETPGLGGEISNPNWTMKWENKVAVDDSGKPIIKTVKTTPNGDSEVDAITGATLTSAGVTNTVQFWLGDKGYGPFLRALRNGQNTTEAN